MKRITFLGIACLFLSSISLKSQCLKAPFTESFNSSTQPSCIITSEISGESWQFNQISWDVTSCTEPSDHTGNSGSFAAKDHSSIDQAVIFEFDTIDVSKLTNPYLSFSYYMCGTGYSPVNILAIETFDGTDWVGVDTIQDGLGDWTEYGYDLSGHVFGTDLLKVRFRAESGGSPADSVGDQGIDDISIIELPCFKPSLLSTSNATSTTIDLAWTENNTATQWLVEYDTTGFKAGSARNSVLVNTDAFTTLTALKSNINYDFYVRTICAVGDTSERSSAVSFTTLPCSDVTTLKALPASNFSNLSWIENGTAAQWEVEYDTAGFTAGMARNVVVVDTDPLVTVKNLRTNTDYDFYVRAICGVSDESEWSKAGSFTTSCSPAPNNLYNPIFLDVSETTANIRWDENTGASEWVVEYDLAGFMAGAGKNFVVVRDTFTTLSALTPSSSYEYYVRSICGAGDTSGYSLSAHFTTACGVPTSLSANAGSNQAEINWTEAATATEWEIQYGAPGFTAGTGTSAIANSNPFTITGLRTSTDYEFYVRAICGIGDASEFSRVSSFTTGICDVVTNLSSANVSLDTVDLSWTESGTAIAWEVSYGAVGYTAGTGTQEVAEINPFTLKGLDSEENYHWYVRAICGAGDSSVWSDTAAFTTPSCAIPTNLSASVMSTDTADITWIENGAAAEWEIAFGVAGFDLNSGEKIVANTNPVTLKGLAAGTDYEFYVRAICNSNDTSNWSMSASFTTEAIYYTINTLNTEDVDGIADSLNVYCWTSGIVMGVDLDGNNGLSFYITDESSGTQEGINVFNFNDVSNYVVVEGDSIRVRGTIIQFNGLTEVNADSIELISSGNSLPSPMFATTLNETTEAKLIELYDLVLLDPSGSGSYNMRAVTHTGLDTLTIRVDGDTDVDDSLDTAPLLAGDTICKIIGIGGQFDNTSPFTEGYQIFPIRFSDIDSSTCINIVVNIDKNGLDENVNSFELYPNPSNGEFTINTSGFTSPTVQLTIKDIGGRVVANETINNANRAFQKAFNIRENAKGIYFISVFDGNQIINKKFILQ